MCLVLALTSLSALGFCSCDGQISFRGISNFDENNSTVEIAYAPYIIVDKKRNHVFELYEYIEGDYFYYSMNEMFGACFDTWREMSLLYLTFEESIYEEAVADMKVTYNLEGCEVENFIPEVSTDIYSLLGLLAEQKGLEGMTDAQLLEELIAMNGTFRVSYMAEIRR